MRYEVVTNAVRHGAAPIELQIVCEAEQGLVVRVRDAGTAPPVLKDPDAQAESGRGLDIVDAVSDDWGTDITATGTHVWFRLHSIDAPADCATSVPAPRSSAR